MRASGPDSARPLTATVLLRPASAEFTLPIALEVSSDTVSPTSTPGSAAPLVSSATVVVVGVAPRLIALMPVGASTRGVMSATSPAGATSV